MAPLPIMKTQCFLRYHLLSPSPLEQRLGSGSYNHNPVENAVIIPSQHQDPYTQNSLLDDNHLFIVATDENYQVILNLPGFTTADLCVKIRDDHTLFLKGRQPQHNEESSTTGGFGDKGFKYTIPLPEDVSANDASACMENGRLIVSFATQGNLKSPESRLQKDRGLIVPKDKERNKILIDVREFRKDGQVIVKFIGKRHLVVEGVAGNKSKQTKNDPENRISRHFYLPKDVDLRTLESVRIKSSEGFLVLHIPSGKPRLDLLEVTIPILNDKTSKPKIFGRTKILKKNDNKNENITRTRRYMDSEKARRHHHLIKRDTNMPEIQDPVFNGEDSEAESVVTIIPSEHQEGIFYRATVV
ncbi:unnamed protein product, partial [Meganyctiphanes norvegica]